MPVGAVMKGVVTAVSLVGRLNKVAIPLAVCAIGVLLMWAGVTC